MMAVFLWVLLGLAIVDVVFAIVQLVFLYEMKLFVYDMKRSMAWTIVVGPSVLSLVLAIVFLNLPLESHPTWALALVIVGYVWLFIVALYQWAASKPILDRLREWNQEKARSEQMAD